MTTMQSDSPHDGRLVSIQVLRALAALMVATGHLYSIDQRFFGGPVLPAVTQFGFAGVDLFFVLSGFVMVYLTRVAAGNVSVAPAFLFARAARIYPLWWMALAAIVLVWSVRPDWVFSSVSGPPHLLADFALWPSAGLPLLAVGWTLIHEMYFYAVFALLLMLRARYLYLGVGVWMALITLANLLLVPQLSMTSPLLALATHPLTLEFGLGVAVGAAAAQGIRPNPIALLVAGIMWALTAALLKVSSPLSVFENDWTRVLSFGPALALLVWGMVGMEVDRGQVPGKAIAGLGDASYSLYLIHVPVFAACARVGALFCGPGAWDNVVAWLFLLTIAATSALILHHRIEKPLLKKLTQFRHKMMPTGSTLLPSPPPPLSPLR